VSGLCVLGGVQLVVLVVCGALPTFSSADVTTVVRAALAVTPIRSIVATAATAAAAVASQRPQQCLPLCTGHGTFLAIT